MGFTSLEVCTGAGGQALGIEQAGFQHLAVVEIEPQACETLRVNRPSWRVLEQDVRTVDGHEFVGIDLLAAGIPCPPFSVAGKRLGHLDERDLFPEVLRLVREAGPRAVFVENVPGLLEARFDAYRAAVQEELEELGYSVQWSKLNASDFGVPQLRPRAAMVAMRIEDAAWFKWPQPAPGKAPTVGEVLLPEMASLGWRGAKSWAQGASAIAPTLVGGSSKHGGPDLGPTRAREAWARLGVDGIALADEPPRRDFSGPPRLTVTMAAILQGFPPEWRITGRKTRAYRQVGNAFPPPVARAIGLAIRNAFERAVADRVTAAAS